MAGRSLAWLVLPVAFACSPAQVGSDAPATTTTTGNDEGQQPTTADTSVTSAATGVSATTTADSGESTGDDDCENECGCLFLIDCVDQGDSLTCDPWAQDCPAGEKCMPWANDGGPWWNSTLCSPIARDAAQLGEACLVEGSAVSGIDDCAAGLMCLWVDPDAGVGTCVEMCTGSEAEPQCSDPLEVCVVAFDGVVIDCLPTCDPLLQDCVAQAACVPYGDNFVCGDPIDTPGDVGDGCTQAWDCSPGAFCAIAAHVPDCVAEGCCTSFCDLNVPMHDCLPGQMCQTFPTPPLGLDNVGRCALP